MINKILVVILEVEGMVGGMVMSPLGDSYQDYLNKGL